MSEMEVLYTANEVYSRLHVSGSTLRKYTDVLQREGYDIKKNRRGRREYTEYDVMLIERIVELSKADGMTLEKAAKMIVTKLGYVSEVKQEKEEGVLPFYVQQILQERDSAIIERITQVQQARFLEIEQRLTEKLEEKNRYIEADLKKREEREERIEKRLEQRDESLMSLIRGIQEMKHTMEQVAADKKKRWWKFWS